MTACIRFFLFLSALAASIVAGSVPAHAQTLALEAAPELDSYRQIGVHISANDAPEGSRIILRYSHGGAPSALHSEFQLRETAGLRRADAASDLHICSQGETPIFKDEAGANVIAPGTISLRCALSGMAPQIESTITATLEGNDGSVLVQSSPLIAATAFADTRLEPPDTRPILFILGALLLSIIAVLSFLRWQDVRRSRTNDGFAHAYIAPAIIALVLLTFYPISYGIWLAFTDAAQTRLGEASFVGLSNFGEIATSPGLLQVSLFTAFWTVGNVAFHIGLGLALALLLTRKGLRGTRVYRAILLLPWAIPAYISILAWQGMLQPEGLLNQMLGAQIDFLGEVNTARLVVTLVNIWLGVPFMMISLTGALNAIPRDMYEAAEIDGVSPLSQFLNITLPNLKSALVPLSLLGVIWTFNSFNTIYLLTRGGPYLGFGQPGATDIIVTYIFDVAFEYGQYGVAAAWSVVVFALLVGFSYFYLRFTRATERVT